MKIEITPEELAAIKEDLLRPYQDSAMNNAEMSAELQRQVNEAVGKANTIEASWRMCRAELEQKRQVFDRLRLVYLAVKNGCDSLFEFANSPETRNVVTISVVADAINRILKPILQHRCPVCNGLVSLMDDLKDCVSCLDKKCNAPNPPT